MRIQNNIMAMNTHRMYSINNSKTEKSAEKLSSGYKINRAGDDAAGLAISEKMRSQVRGLGMASKNSQDAISLVQTAEGALQEVHSMLQRMNELAVQSATGTNQELDRDQLNKEFDQLKREINQIAEQTTFNNMNILDGTLSNEGPLRSAQTVGIFGTTIEERAKEATHAYFEMDLKGLYIEPDVNGLVALAYQINTIAGGFGGTVTQTEPLTDVEFVELAMKMYPPGNDLFGWTISSLDGTKIRFTHIVPGELTPIEIMTSDYIIAPTSYGILTQPVSKSVNVYYGKDAVPAKNSTLIDFDQANMKDGDRFSLKVGGETISAVWHDGMTKADFMADLASSITANSDTATVDGNKLILHGHVLTQEEIAAAFIPGPPKDGSYGTMPIQVGALEKEQLNIEVKPMNTYGLGLDNAYLNTQDIAGKAITSMRNAINLVSDQRSLLGAMQNRLEHKISNLDNTGENLQSAESRIRDVDFAKEMTSFTKNNILGQASTSMLAQANAAPQNVLSLLQ